MGAKLDLGRGHGSLASHDKEKSQKRCRREMRSKAFDLIRDKKVIERKSEGLRLEEHKAIPAAENNVERELFHQIFLETGAAQSDAAALSIRNVDWQSETLAYVRLKTCKVARLKIGPP